MMPNLTLKLNFNNWNRRNTISLKHPPALLIPSVKFLAWTYCYSQVGTLSTNLDLSNWCPQVGTLSTDLDVSDWCPQVGTLSTDLDVSDWCPQVGTLSTDLDFSDWCPQVGPLSTVLGSSDWCPQVGTPSTVLGLSDWNKGNAIDHNGRCYSLFHHNFFHYLFSRSVVVLFSLHQRNTKFNFLI